MDGRKGEKGKMKTLQELKQAYIDAELEQRNEYRRAVWYERRLYEAETGGSFESRLATLNYQEKLLQELGQRVSAARREYLQAEAAARLAATQ